MSGPLIVCCGCLFLICGLGVGIFWVSNLNCFGPLCPEEYQCNVNSSLKEEIASYSDVVNKIFEQTTDFSGKYKGKVWDELAYFTDRFGNRFTGTKNLENSIDYMNSLLNKYNLDNVHTEDVSVPIWTR